MHGDQVIGLCDKLTGVPYGYKPGEQQYAYCFSCKRAVAMLPDGSIHAHWRVPPTATETEVLLKIAREPGVRMDQLEVRGEIPSVVRRLAWSLIDQGLVKVDGTTLELRMPLLEMR